MQVRSAFSAMMTSFVSAGSLGTAALDVGSTQRMVKEPENQMKSWSVGSLQSFIPFPLPSSYTHVLTFPMQIFIKTLTGRKQAFNFEPENQVLAVKQALQEKEGIQVDQIRLIHSGKQLADDKTLESYNIGAGATIHMVLQLRGGCNN
jgi:ubiquitin-like protein Nedd8